MASFKRSRGPSFFKAMADDFIKDMRIPPAFVKHFDGVVPHKSRITRSTPDGKEWSVYIQKIGQCFFFRKGWREFVEDNFIQSGDFLVFHYVGNSKFEVVIYGKHSCEKELSAATLNNHEPHLKGGDTLQENVKREKGSQSGKSGKGTKGGSEEADKCKINAAENKIRDIKRNNKVIHIKSDIDSSSSDELMDSTDEYSNGSSTDESSDTTAYRPQPRGKLKKAVEENQKAKSLKSSSKFVSNYPFFRAVMRSSYLLANYLWIPKQFSRILSKGGSRKVKLWASDRDRLWTVKLLISQKGRGMFTSGWNVFVKDNALRMGDVCVFEMLEESKEPLLKVSFFKYLP